MVAPGSGPWAACLPIGLLRLGLEVPSHGLVLVGGFLLAENQ